MTDTSRVIDNFTGPYGFLSNFYASTNQLRARFLVEGVSAWAYVPTVEHAFQAAKASNLADWDRIVRAGTAAQAKRYGRSVTLREDWEQVKDEVMRQCLIQKFSHADFAEKLIETAPAELVEGNHWGDHYWGRCNGVGENMLGRLLMEIRERIGGGELSPHPEVIA